MEAITNYWDPDLGISHYVITTKDGTKIVGTAQCSPKDRDMLNELTGGEIAEMRARIKYYKYIKNKQLRPELKTLKKFLYTINKSKYYNEKDYPNQMLLRAIKRLEDDIEDVESLIIDTEYELKNYLKYKGEFYQKIRAKRSKQAENEQKT